jgi:hypothetical protein
MSPLLIKAAVGLALVAGVWLHGRHVGAGGVQADWDAAELQRERAIQAQEASQRRQAAAAGERYEAQRAALHANATQARAALLEALQRPACATQEDAHARTLADLPVPAAAVQRLRDAAGPANPP